MLAQGRSLNHASLAVTDVEKAAEFYGKLLNAKVVSRPGNGGINLGLGDGFSALCPNSPILARSTTSALASTTSMQTVSRPKCKEMGITATVDRNPANRTSGGDQLYPGVRQPPSADRSARGYQG